MTIENVFNAVADDFGKGKIPCLIIGGIAVNFYKYNRQTTDVDFMLDKASYDQARRGLEKLGYHLARQQDTFAQFESAQPDLTDIDLMFVDTETLAEVLKDAQEIVMRGKTYLVPSLNNLIALKLHSSKGSKHRELKDLLDIVMLIKINKIDTTAKSFRELCLKFGNEHLYQKIIEHSPGGK